MGLITLIFLLAFTALYLSKSLEKKPEMLTQAVAKISENLDKVSLWGGIYGVAGFVLTPIMAHGGGEMLVRLLANLMIVMMALPFVFEHQSAKLQEKVNPAILDEVKNFSGCISKQEKYIGYAGAVIALLLLPFALR